MPSTTARSSLAMSSGMRWSIVEGCAAMVPQTLTTGVFLTGFALTLGAEPWAIGLLAAVPALAQSAQLLAPWLMGRGVARKPLTVWSATLGRAVWALLVLVPFLPLDAGARLALFFSLLAVSTVLGQVAGAAWTDWMSDMVPASTRGRYFGLRTSVTALVGLGVTAAGARFLDGFAPGDRPRAFLALGVAILVASAASMGALSRQSDSAARAPRRPSRSPFRAPLANRPFMRLTAWMAGWTFVSNLTGGFSYAYALRELHVGYGVVGAHALVLSALSVVSVPLWGRLIDRRGAQTALIVAMAPVCLHPLYWLVARPEFVTPIFCDAVSGGLFWSGVTLALTTLLMEAAPSGERAAYVGVYNAATGVAIAIASTLGGVLLSLGAPAGLSFAGHALSVWQTLLIVGASTRLACAVGLAASPRVGAPLLMIETRVAETPAPLPHEETAPV